MQPYLISDFPSGISDYLQPWIRAQDAWSPLENAYTYRGTLNKRTGYTQYGNQLADENPVMGIMQRIDESTGQITLAVASTTNLYSYNTVTNEFDPVTSVLSSTFWTGTATGTLVTATFFPNLAPGSVHITDGATTIDDNGSGGFNSTGIFAAGGTVDYTTGVVTLNFTGTTTNVTLSLTATSTDYFTGDNTNFFHYVNWQPTDPNTLAPSTSYLYMTNNVDPITLFDGVNVSRPIFYINDSNTDWIERAIDVNVFSNRLLIFRPKIHSSANVLNQSIYYSALFNPFNFKQSPGNGGQVTVATGDLFIAEEFLRNAIVMCFTNSTWLLRFSGITTDPFRVDKISGAKRHNSTYGTVSYDERMTSLGSTGLIACDGVNVQRYDNKIIDYYETQISEQYYQQCFSQRYDNNNQTWMLYVSNGTTNPVVGGGAPGADKALIYNFAEDSWATYTWSVPMTCLGIYFAQTGATWASLDQSWEDTDSTWKSYSNNALSPILLSGDVNGNVYWQDNEDAVTDNGTSFAVNCTSTRWNPIMKAGQKVQFNYIDIYYSVQSVDPANPIELTLNFYVDNSNNVATTKTLTLDGKVGSEFYWKRIYVNCIGQFLQMNIDPVEDSYFQILGLIIWAAPSGRLTP